MAGEKDWLAWGLPTEGRDAARARAGTVTLHAVPTCAPHDPVAGVQTRLAASGQNECVVINPDGIVLGRVHADDLAAGATGVAADVMDPAPATVRPSEELAGLVARMAEHGVARILVTTPDGKLIGELRRTDADRLLQTNPAETHAGVAS